MNARDAVTSTALWSTPDAATTYLMLVKNDRARPAFIALYGKKLSDKNAQAYVCAFLYIFHFYPFFYLKTRVN